MQYYSHDPNGLYSGSGEAEPGDVPGSFYYPTNSVTEAPPTLEPGAWRWNGTAWAEVTAEEQAAARLAGLKAALAANDRANLPALYTIVNALAGDEAALAVITEKQAAHEAAASQLRAELKALEGQQ
jgi:hypothetical protein